MPKLLLRRPLALLLFISYGISSPALAQGAFSAMRDMLVEGAENVPALTRARDNYNSAIERFNDRFVEPVVRFGEQYKCSAGYKGDECEQMFPEARERMGELRESAQNRLKSLATSGQAAIEEARVDIAEQSGQARSGLQHLLESDVERDARANSLRALYREEAIKEKERADALNARNIAEQQQMARKFAEDQARLQQEGKRAANEAAALAQHESEVNQAVGLFLNMMNAASASRPQARQPTYKAPSSASSYSAPSGQGSNPQGGGRSCPPGMELYPIDGQWLYCRNR